MNSLIHQQRMEIFSNAGLYLVTSASMSNGRSTLDVIREALKGGVLLIQLREKDCNDEELLELATAARRMTHEAGALLLINDRLDIAEQCEADGVHLGLEDMSLEEARERAPDMIIGGSSHSLDEAMLAQAQGASYVNIGPIYPTKTKNWQEAYLGLEAIKEIAPHLSIPWSVMGGIKKRHIPDLVGSGAKAIAVVTAVTMADDIAAECRELIELIAESAR
jgi:thiamine-phosphate pyrophosphorylase